MSTQYRIKVIEDREPYEYGDATEEEVAEINAIIERDGVWGYVVEKLVPATEACSACGHSTPEHWEHVDSCFGFLGNDAEYMLEQARNAIRYDLEQYEDLHPSGALAGAAEAPVVDEHGREV